MKQFILLVAILVAAATHVAAQTAARPAPKPATTTPKPPPTQVAATQGMTNADIVNMVTAGLSEAVIAQSIRDANERSFDLSPNGLVALKKANVPDGLISVMLNPSVSIVPIAVAEPPRPTTVKIQDGTPLKLIVAEEISSATAKSNDLVRLESQRTSRSARSLRFQKGPPSPAEC